MITEIEPFYAARREMIARWVEALRSGRISREEAQDENAATGNAMASMADLMLGRNDIEAR
ncbi:hypothetical protein [Acidomonas methanolica]|uniref:RsbT co-antagonist protein RsbRD N-terminal domain-containing protein n=1 Tax=Acidomonas methanolica NBRC 104435 TaxID=1231351 RepID=A0A023D7H8_ACIMT|nr:hypothetical protein [Acidomonas methanolica]TCS24126.1 hypothetical protein EDC31_12547 [Acidomonas methanolica]GAJ29721.1 hypothetical protein Amme_076_014 [Acidomonas methanolica NBRC 104435]GBQ59489.1 hypothetical protein AA0498_2767 [Acidomonas methanolica]GEL00041.1 hypothetical protein AME01nite_25390 [Acidomonas methanolica NBRC 104435]